MQPKIQFKLNKDLDVKMSLVFIDMKAAGVDFSKKIVELHPALKVVKTIKSEHERQEKINDYVSAYYKTNRSTLVDHRDELQEKWDSVQEKFFEVVNQIFHGHKFPEGEYVGYLSIFDANPRFLENKTFQVYMNHSLGGVFIAAHELLHFIFYDYAQTNFPELFDGVDTENGFFWEMAELFNSVVLATKLFVAIHGVEKVSAYPDHEQYIDSLKKVWDASKDVDIFIKEAYALLKD